MTDEEITERRRHVNRTQMMFGMEWRQTFCYTSGEYADLLAEVERLRASLRSHEYADTPQAREALEREHDRFMAEHEAMHEIVEAVANLSSLGNDLCFCYHHDEMRNFVGQTEEWLEMGKPHKPECIYAKARALLASGRSSDDDR